jgi:hypothetical protein
MLAPGGRCARSHSLCGLRLKIIARQRDKTINIGEAYREARRELPDNAGYDR